MLVSALAAGGAYWLLQARHERRALRRVELTDDALRLVRWWAISRRLELRHVKAMAVVRPYLIVEAGTTERLALEHSAWLLAAAVQSAQEAAGLPVARLYPPPVTRWPDVAEPVLAGGFAPIFAFQQLGLYLFSVVAASGLVVRAWLSGDPAGMVLVGVLLWCLAGARALVRAYARMSLAAELGPDGLSLTSLTRWGKRVELAWRDIAEVVDVPLRGLRWQPQDEALYEIRSTKGDYLVAEIRVDERELHPPVRAALESLNRIQATRETPPTG